MVDSFSEESLRKIAERKVQFRQTVKTHAAAFLIVNALLIAVNLIFSAGYYWFLFPLFGWFIGLSLHYTAYLMYANGVYPYMKRGVYFHIVAFATVMLLLVVINLMTTSIYWVIYPAIFWGAGLIAHIVIYVVNYKGDVEKGETKSKKEKLIEKEMQKMRKKSEQ